MSADRTLDADEQRLWGLVQANLSKIEEAKADCLIAVNAGITPTKSALWKLELALRGANAAMAYIMERAKGNPPPKAG